MSWRQWGLGLGVAAASAVLVLGCSATTEPSASANGGGSGGFGAVSGGASGSGAGGFVASGGDTGNGGVFIPPSTRPDAAAPECAHADVSYERVVPTVWLMIDASGSMSAPLVIGGPPRFQLVRDALLAAGSGIVVQLDEVVKFGLFLYDGCGPGFPGPGCLPGECPRVASIEPKLQNATAIEGGFPTLAPGASTPTDVALAALADHIGATASTGPKPPSYVVLATDGEPNLCDWHDGIPSNDVFRQNAVDAITRMVDGGTKVFVISLAGQDPALQAYFDRVATAGGTGEPAFIPGNNDDLVNALRKILGGAVPCEVKLTGTIAAGKECSGTVTFDGKALTCGDANGWRAKDASTIELQGEACKTLQQSPSGKISVSFPCDVYVPIR